MSMRLALLVAGVATLLGRVLCWLGAHRWVDMADVIGIEPYEYESCSRCRRTRACP